MINLETYIYKELSGGHRLSPSVWFQPTFTWNFLIKTKTINILMMEILKELELIIIFKKKQKYESLILKIILRIYNLK